MKHRQLVFPVALLTIVLFALILLRRTKVRDTHSATYVEPPASSINTILEKPGIASLLWQRPRGTEPGHAEQSLWLQPDGSIAREEPGLFVSQGSHTARLEQTLSSFPLPPCPRGHTPFPERRLHQTILRFEQGREVELIPRAEMTPSLVEEFHIPLAALDDLLFFRIDRVEDPCTEQPRYISSFVVFHIEITTVKKIEISIPPIPISSRKVAASRINARLLPFKKITESDLLPTMVLPLFSGEKATWEVLLTARVPWELSHGGWGSETASEMVALDGAPSWGNTKVISSTVLAYARSHSGTIVFGTQRWMPRVLPQSK